LALAFNLSGLPATVIVAPTREILAVRQGYLGPDELDRLLSEALAARRGRKGGEGRGAAGSASAVSGPARTVPGRPQTEEPLALAGYCPVSLISGRRLVPGQAEYTVEHEGRVYRFASSVMSHLFRGDPDRYIPGNRGECPVSQVDRDAAQPGDPK